MPHTSIPWCLNTRFFLTFFQENPLALKSFCAALLSIPDTQIISCTLRGSAFPATNYPTFCPDSETLSVTLHCPKPYHLDIIPPASANYPSRLAERLISLLPSSVPLFPSTPFLKIHLLYPQQSTFFSNRLPFYSEVSYPSTLCSSRFLNLSPHTAPLLHTPLYDYSRLLLLRYSSELHQLCCVSSSLSPILPLLEEYLRNQEIDQLFQNNTGFSSVDGIQLMCSLNRLLIKEKRVSELWEASKNPALLLELFRQYQEKGYF